jgi:hypothetical protein
MVLQLYFCSVIFLILILPVFGQNTLSNGRFEKGTTGWRWEGKVDADVTVRHGGTGSIRLTGKGRLFQVHELVPGQTYLVGGWFKGRSIEKARFQNVDIPKGDFDWRWIGREYTLGGNENTVLFEVTNEGQQGTLWADDLYVGPPGTGGKPPKDYPDRPDDSALRAKVSQRVREERSHADRIRKLLKDRPKLEENAYVKMGLVLADLFLERADTGGPWQKQLADEGGPMAEQRPDWSLMQLNQIQEVLNETQRLIENGPIPDAPRPDGGPVRIRNGVFYTETTRGDRPFYFYGYGAGSTIAQAIPFLPELGANYIQQERGPSSMDAEGKIIPDDYNMSIFKAFASASAHRVKVDILFSPHYFPRWAITQAPDVYAETGGWNRFNVNHPKAREVVEKWIEAVLSKTKKEPSLFTCCLMNEPAYNVSGRDSYSRPLYIEFLKKRHSSIEALNELYGKNYFRFDEVVVPTTTEPKSIPARRAYFDWALFNMDNFARWHRFMHDEVKKTAPQAYTHTKIILDAVFTPQRLHSGVDPELICEATDLAGNDCAAVLTSDYAFTWLPMEMGYDLLHSFKNQPVVNTENHIDYDPVGADYLNGYPPAGHIRGVLWQSALHHLSATAIWNWSEPTDRVRSGHINLRPANIYSAGKTMFDINRLAEEITAINQSPPAVALLYSVASIFWQEDYSETIQKVYTALNFMGLQITFVSERQLAAGMDPKARIIILPHATHGFDKTVTALQTFIKNGGILIKIGKDNLAFDEYHRRRKLESIGTITEIEKLQETLLSVNPKISPLYDLKTLKPAWGVEYRVVTFKGKTLVSMMNLLPGRQSVKLDIPGRAVDLVSGRLVDQTHFTLEPMIPFLLEISSPRP